MREPNDSMTLAYPQAARDLYWQEKMHTEREAARHATPMKAGRKAHALAARARGQPQTPAGPAAGVAAELRRIHCSGILQVSPEAEARCTAFGWTRRGRFCHSVVSFSTFHVFTRSAVICSM